MQEGEQESYTDGITAIQTVGTGLNVPPEILSQSLWLFAEYHNSLNAQRPSLCMDAFACLTVISQKSNGATTSSINPSAIIQYIKGILNIQNSGSNGVSNPLSFLSSQTISEDQIHDSVLSINDFIYSSNYKSPTLSTFEVTMQKIQALFGGSHWKKEKFGESVVQIAMGVVNDLFRSVNCTKHHPDHWAFAAIHYAICAHLTGVRESKQKNKLKFFHVF